MFGATRRPTIMFKFGGTNRANIPGHVSDQSELIEGTCRSYNFPPFQQVICVCGGLKAHVFYALSPTPRIPVGRSSRAVGGTDVYRSDPMRPPITFIDSGDDGVLLGANQFLDIL